MDDIQWRRFGKTGAGVAMPVTGFPPTLLRKLFEVADTARLVGRVGRTGERSAQGSEAKTVHPLLVYIYIKIDNSVVLLWT